MGKIKMPRGTYPSDLADAFVVRFPQGMRQKMKQRAAINHRSMNSEIVVILAAALGDQNATTAGQSFQAHPAVASEHTALAGGASSSTQASGEPR